MDLSRFDSLGARAPDELKARYQQLRRQLVALLAEAATDMKAVDAVIVELDEIQAAFRDSTKDAGDPQRF